MARCLRHREAWLCGREEDRCAAEEGGQLIAYPLFALLLIGLVLFGLIRAWLPAPTSRSLVAVSLGAWLVALLSMTLRPAGSRVRLNLVPDLGGADFSAFDTLANIAVFAPFGLILATAGWKALPVIALGFAVSLAVEVTQLIVDVGRAADVNDLITNTTGAAAGWALGWAIRAARRRAAARRARA